MHRSTGTISDDVLANVDTWLDFFGTPRLDVGRKKTFRHVCCNEHNQDARASDNARDIASATRDLMHAQDIRIEWKVLSHQASTKRATQFRAQTITLLLSP